MDYTKEFDVEHFEFWSGAKDRTEDLSLDQLKALGNYIEECFADRTPTETEINDFVWFSCDDFLAEITARDEEPDEDDDDCETWFLYDKEKKHYCATWELANIGNADDYYDLNGKACFFSSKAAQKAADKINGTFNYQVL